MSDADIRKIDKEMDFANRTSDGMDWYSVDDQPFCLDGLHWRKKGEAFRRLPLTGCSISPYIDATLSWHTAGAMLRFVTDAAEIRVDVKLHKNATFSLAFDKSAFKNFFKKY